MLRRDQVAATNRQNQNDCAVDRVGRQDRVSKPDKAIGFSGVDQDYDQRGSGEYQTHRRYEPQIDPLLGYRVSVRLAVVIQAGILPSLSNNECNKRESRWLLL